MVELLSLAAQTGKGFSKIAPWVMENPRRKQKESATPDEIAAAEAALEAGIVFAQ